MKDKFKNKDGSLTLYSLMCGYREEASGDDILVTLSLEFPLYRVKSIDWHKSDIRGGDINNWNSGNGFRGWQSFDKLKDARKFFYAECRRLNIKPTHRK